ncbi:MAG: PAS domain S-box protein [Hydrogenophilaceae bacterium]
MADTAHKRPALTLSYWRPWFFALLAALLVLAAEQVIEHFAKGFALERERISVHENLATVRARLEGVINANLLLVHGLTAVISAHPDIDQAEFSRIARGLINPRHALRNIAGAPDMVISLMYPLEGNQAAIGLDYRTHPVQRDAALRVMATGQAVVAGPLQLEQGGTGIVAREPVYVPASTEDGKPHFWGLVSAVIDVDVLYRQSGLTEANPDLHIAIRGANGKGAQGGTFFGDDRIFALKPVSQEVLLPGGTWQIAAIPARGWGQPDQSLWLIRLLGILSALVVAAMVYRMTEGAKHLAMTAARLRSLLNTLPDLVWMKDPQGVYLACNPRFEQFFGAREEAILGKTDHDFLSPELVDFFREKDLAAIAVGGPSSNDEWVTFASDDHRELLETIKTPVYGQTGNLLGVLGIARDITRRHLAEERILQLNRVYAVLSGINESIVRLRDPDSLFREACRIAVEVGGFRMAWIGMADPVSGQVSPVASAGQVDGYLDLVHVSLGEDEHGRGPTGMALRQGQHVVCADIANDPRMAPWREDALARGYRSSVGLPIRIGEQVRGVFSLYAGQAGFFDAEELKLLDELALDIGFAMEFMQTRTRVRESETILDSVFQALPDLFFLLDSDGTIRDYRAHSGGDLYVPPEDFLGRRMQEVLPAETATLFENHLNHVQKQGGLATFEYDLPFPQGKRHFEARLSRLPDNAQVIAVVRDITGQYHGRLALLDSEARYRHLFMHNPASMLIYERGSLRLLAVNEAFLDHYGYSLDEAMALTLTDLYPDNEKRPIADLAARLAGLAYAGEWHHLKKDGTVMAIEAHSHDIDYQGHDARIAVILDITSRKQVEIALREQEAFFRLIAENMGDLVAVLDLNGRRLYNSPSYSALFGDPDALKGSDSFAEIHPDDREQVRQAFMHTVATGVGQRLNFRFVLPDGNVREMESQGGVIRGPDGKVERVVVVSRDITERKRLEDEIRQLNEELEQRVLQRTAQLEAANKELETFTYSVSHDLKAPLRGIDGYSRLLLDDHYDRLDEEGKLFLGNVRHGVDQMSQLIEDLLAYSRMERRDLHGIELDLARLVTGALAERQDELNAKGVQVELDLAAGTVRADPDGLNMVLRNLIDNAVKFSHASQSPRIEIKSVSGPESTILSIRDNGIGFDMRFHERIFEIFQRLQRAEDYPGTGVGLAIVRKAMLRMGGRVWADSTPGQGATFYLELPR